MTVLKYLVFFSSFTSSVKLDVADRLNKRDKKENPRLPMADELVRNICGRLLKMSAGQHVLIGGSELDGWVRRRRGKGEEARWLPKASCLLL